MKPRRQSSRAIVCVFATVLALISVWMLSAGTVDAAAGAAPAPSIWTIARTPSPDQFNNLISAISADSPDDIWATGQLSIHWDGQKWTAIPMVKKGDLGSFEMDGVAAISPTDVWSVGQYGDGGVHHSLIEHWDGTKWKIFPSAHFQAGEILMGVSAISSTDVWAIGWYVNLSLNSILPLAEHWDGSRWKFVQTISVANSNFFLNKLAIVSDSDIWAVGFTGNLSGSDRTFAMHWNGQKWSIVPTPSVGGGENQLWGVTALATDDVWTVGSSEAAGQQTLIEHWDGRVWSVVPSPNVTPSQGNRLFGVGAISSTSVWAVGSFFAPNGSGRQLTLVEHWDGAQWTVSPSPNRGSSDTLFGVAAIAPGKVWIGGTALVPPAFNTLVLQTEQGQ